ncbi:MAG: hypothetical protein DWQ07_09350 [Chloroflexi bacterium]|nr:MAG: hypothetical protein DWQ07_09350 [Chloroflexota bacterium]MBL1193081.1 hypothetical protein [Chloroflexota bacterium]NOH10374.1 hypothetical protein [Chloroflexota bacterium]
MPNLKSFLQRIYSYFEWFFTYRNGIPFFILGTLIYVLFHIWLLAKPLTLRPMPIESDDGYSFILKAEEMRSCFLQDCPALEDLEEQLLASSSNSQTALIRFRQYHRVFIVYHPYFSTILLGLNEMGLNWEQSFDLISFSGTIFVTLAIAYWASRLWGYGPAGLGLILLSLHNFPGTATYYTTPTTISLGLACLTWGWILQRRGKSSSGMLFGIFLMLGMHTMGRLYSLLALALYFLIIKQRFSKKALITLGIGFSLVAFSFLLPVLISRPHFAFSPYDFYPGELEFFVEVELTITAMWSAFLFWSNTYGATLIVVILVIASFNFLPRERFRANLLMTGLLFGLFVASIFFVFPWFPAIAASRIWIPVAALITGSLGYILWHWSSLAVNKLIDFLKHTPQGISWKTAGEQLFRVTITSVLLFYVFSNAYQHASHHFPRLQMHMLTTKDADLPTAQLKTLLDKTTSSDAVVYLDEIGLYFALSNSQSYNRGAVYFPAVLGTQEYDKWIDNNNDLRYVFGRSPIDRLDTTSRGAIIISAGDRLAITILQPIQISILYLRFSTQNLGDAARLQFSVNGEQETIKIPSNIVANQWVAIKLPGEIVLEKFTLHAVQGIKLDGVQFSSGANELRWPWKIGITLNYTYKEGQHLEENLETTLSEAQLSRFLGLPINILSDDGSFILAEIER